MMPYSAILSFVFYFLLVVVSLANPFPFPEAVVLPFTTNFKSLGTHRRTSGLNIATASRARAAVLHSNYNQTGRQLSSESVSFPIDNAFVTYTASVGIGSPAKQYKLLIDTGSSNTWCGAGTSYVKTNSSQDTGNKLTIQYGSGTFDGDLYTDTVTLAPKFVIKSQYIGVATQSSGLDGYDGILGVGPTDLTAGTVVGQPQTLLPTVTDKSFHDGIIPAEVMSAFYVPAFVGSSPSASNGELTFGGVDMSKVVGSIYYAPMTTASPANHYWGVQSSMQIGSGGTSDPYVGIVDTGTTLILTPSDFFKTYLKATGGVIDAATGLILLTADQYNNLKPLSFKIGPDKTEFELIANAQLFPRRLNTAIGGKADGYYLVVGDIGRNSGAGLDFILGYTFLERVYTIYDGGKKQIGFAKTQYTTSNLN